MDKLIFRLFISSTFSDFELERQALQQKVFPELRRFCEGLGAVFVPVDLRWGITAEAQQEHATLRICLEEVRRCQQLSPKPNFAVLLGNRYGWEPAPARIPLDHWRRFLTQCQGPEQAAYLATLQATYEGPDTNAVPPMMTMRAALPFKDQQSALDALRRAAEAAGLQGDERLPYFTSATHQEIVLGALNAPGSEAHVHAYVRDIAGLPRSAAAEAFVDGDGIHPVPHAQSQLQALQVQLRQRLPERVHDLQARWNGKSGLTEEHLEAFCAMFLQHQKALIQAQVQAYAQSQALSASQAREAEHRGFAQERARNFVGRRQTLQATQTYLLTHSQRPLVLHAVGGGGKSATLAQVVGQATQGSPGWVPASPAEPVMLARFFGGVPGLEALQALLHSLTQDLAEAYGQAAPLPAADVREAAEAFADALGYASEQRPLWLFLDALDQLDPADQAWALEWLPRELPPHVRLLASARDGELVSAAQARWGQDAMLPLPPLSPSEGEEMLKAWLASGREAHFNAGIEPAIARALSPAQQTMLMEQFEASGSNPLWMKLATEEARTWASWEDPEALRTHLPAQVPPLVRNLITERLIKREKHPPILTRQALAYLACGRFGLSEQELDRALATDAAVRGELSRAEEAAKTRGRWEDPHHLPPILWSRLYFDLQPYLSESHTDGARLMRFFHREFKEVVLAELAQGETPPTAALHGHLANTFAALAPDEPRLFTRTDRSATPQSAALRRVMEQPWQLAQAGRKDDLAALLSDFSFVMAKCAANGVDDLLDDLGLAGIYPSTLTEKQSLARIIVRHSRLLRLGEVNWPSHRILLQLLFEGGTALAEMAKTWAVNVGVNWKITHMSRHVSEIAPMTSALPWRGSVKDVMILNERRALVVGYGQAELFDLLAAKSLKKFTSNDEAPSAEFFAQNLKDETFILWFHGGKKLTRFDLSGNVIAALDVGEGMHSLQLLEHSGRICAIFSGLLKIFDKELIETCISIVISSPFINAVRELPNKNIVTMCKIESFVHLYDGFSGQHLSVMKSIKDKGSKKIISAGKNKILIGRNISGNSIGLHDAQRGELVKRIIHRAGIKDFFVSGELVVSYGPSRIRTFQVESGEPVQGRSAGRNFEIEKVVDLCCGELAVLPDDGCVEILDLATLKLLYRGRPHNFPVESIIRLSSDRIATVAGYFSLEDSGPRGAGDFAVWNSRSGEVYLRLEFRRKPKMKILSDGALFVWGESAENAHEEELWIFHKPLVDLRHHISSTTLDQAIHEVIELPNGGVVLIGEEGAVTMPSLGALGSGYRLEGLPLLKFGCARKMGHSGLLSWTEQEVFLTYGLSPALSRMPRQSIEGHSTKIAGHQPLLDGRVVTWAENQAYVWHQSMYVAECLNYVHGLIGEPIVVGNCTILRERSKDSVVRVFPTSEPYPSGRLDHPETVISMGLCDENTLVVSGEKGSVTVWDIERLEQVAFFGHHRDRVIHFRRLSDDRFVTSSLDGTVRVWDSGGKQLAMQRGKRFVAFMIDISKKGRLLSSNNSKAYIWSNDYATITPIFESHVNSAFFVDDDHVLILCSNRRILFIKTGTLEPLFSFSAVDFMVHEIVDSVEFGWVAVCSDGSVRPLCLKSGRLLEPVLRQGKEEEKLSDAEPVAFEVHSEARHVDLFWRTSSPSEYSRWYGDIECAIDRRDGVLRCRGETSAFSLRSVAQLSPLP